ncbi:hypothetical protein COCNU_scaffold000313G000020 [Cocos nucifera]|nr:hypothetical protein [Cocos nucifera]
MNGFKSLKRKDSATGEPSKKPCVEELVLAGEVTEKKKKKKKVVRKRIRRTIENLSGEGSGQEQASLDDREVIRSLMRGTILSHIVDKMVWMDNAVRFDEFCAAFLELGHYLFVHSKVADLHQAEAFKALQEA